MTLQQARIQRDEAKKQLSNHVDPSELRKLIQHKKMIAELDSFEMISPTMPTWEERQQLKQEHDALVAERNNILEYQDRLDAARDRIADGDISEDELEALDAELLDAMPESVQAHVPGMEKQPDSPELSGNDSPPTMRQANEQPENNLTAFVPLHLSGWGVAIKLQCTEMTQLERRGTSIASLLWW